MLERAQQAGGNGAALTAVWLGRVDYPHAWAWQRALFEDRLEGRCGDTLLLLEHPPTYTLGRRSRPGDLLMGETECAARGIGVYRVDRGGRATYHGPGQLVGYPIVALGGRYDVLAYLRTIEEVLMRLAADFGVSTERDPRHTGVWVGRSKLAAIGVKITRGITMHGFAFNVSSDLAMFEGIVPCGITDRGVTSIDVETGVTHSVESAGARASLHMSEILGRPLVTVHGETFLRDLHDRRVTDSHGTVAVPVFAGAKSPTDLSERRDTATLDITHDKPLQSAERKREEWRR